MQPSLPRRSSTRRSSEEKKNDEETLLLLHYQKHYNHNAPFNTEIPTNQRKVYTLVVSLVLLLLVIGTSWTFFNLHRNVDVYDYIVVGGGPAGIIVACKLAAHFPKFSILLLEAGTTSQSAVINTTTLSDFDIPLFWSGVASSDAHHWKVPNAILGKGLGGSGLLSAMIYLRSLRSDWNNISGWDWSDLLEEYESLESFQPHMEKTTFTNRTEIAHRGRHGPIMTIQPSQVDDLATFFLQSGEKAGLVKTSSFNEPLRNNTVGLYEFNIRQGVRDSVARAFLANPPPNLVVKAGATVTRVLMEETATTEKSTRAIGVEFVYEGKVLQSLLRNKKGEVIISAGAIMTPQVLFNSNIDNNHIGTNLHDNLVVCIGYQLSQEAALSAKSIYDVGLELQNYKAAVRELQASSVTKNTFGLNQLGVLGTSGFSAGAFLQSPWSTDAPDIQLTVFPRHMEPLATKANNHVVPNAMLITVALLDAEARLQVYPNRSRTSMVKHVQDADPEVMKRVLGYRLPTIDIPRDRAEYLSELDLRRLAWGVEQVRKIQSEAPLSGYTGPEIYPNVDSDRLNEYIQANVLQNAHFAGTTAIGRVVDERLRVLGAEGLRIVDAGVLPKASSGTMSTVCVIASRAAKMIIEDRGHY